jgi:hypothetical protein
VKRSVSTDNTAEADAMSVDDSPVVEFGEADKGIVSMRPCISTFSRGISGISLVHASLIPLLLRRKCDPDSLCEESYRLISFSIHTLPFIIGRLDPLIFNKAVVDEAGRKDLQTRIGFKPNCANRSTAGQRSNPKSV